MNCFLVQDFRFNFSTIKCKQRRGRGRGRKYGGNVKFLLGGGVNEKFGGVNHFTFPPEKMPWLKTNTISGAFRILLRGGGEISLAHQGVLGYK